MKVGKGFDLEQPQNHLSGSLCTDMGEFNCTYLLIPFTTKLRTIIVLYCTYKSNFHAARPMQKLIICHIYIICNLQRMKSMARSYTPTPILQLVESMNTYIYIHKHLHIVKHTYTCANMQKPKA